MSEEDKYKNIPPKGILNALWRMFDYQDFDTVIDGKTVRDRIYEAWQTIHLIIVKWDAAEPGDFMNWINKKQVDRSVFLGGEEK